jgi:glucokinase
MHFKLEIKQDQIMGVGVGCPGVIDEHGILRAAANFPTWKDVPLQSLFSEKLGYPIRLCNDADAAVMAEHWVGSAKEGIDNCIMLSKYPVKYSLVALHLSN